MQPVRNGLLRFHDRTSVIRYELTRRSVTACTDRGATLIPAKTQTLLRKFSRYFPGLTRTCILMGRQLGETKDGLAHMGQVPGIPPGLLYLGLPL